MKWIPTSERLPSERGEYLVTVDFDGDTYVECFHYGKPMMANREVKGECFYDSDDEWGDVVYDKEVIAWMPLPKPYRKTEPQTDIGTSDTVYSDTAGYVPRVDMTDCSWK